MSKNADYLLKFMTKKSSQKFHDMFKNTDYILKFMTIELLSMHLDH